MAVVAPISGQASLFGSWGSTPKEDEVTKPAAKQKSRYLHDMIHEERRYVLFNSRRLSGECLDICEPKTTEPPGGETNPPTNPPSNPPTDNPTASPTQSPTVAPTKSPTESPTDAPTKSPTNYPTALKAPPGADCEMTNLGYGFSEAIGDPHFSGECYPGIRQLDAFNLNGRDDAVAVFVGGDFLEKKSAEVEGNVVVLGKLKVENQGAGNFVSVGLGSHVLPNSGGDCIIVGGDIEAHRDIQVFNQAPSMKCDIVYRGQAINKGKWKTNGVVRKDANYDLSYYEDMVPVFRKKSEYWANLPATGTVTELWSTTTFHCSQDDNVQVFNMGANDAQKFTSATSYKFKQECQGKTILINMKAHGEVLVNAVDFYDYNNNVGYNDGGFDKCFTQSIIWNFPNANNVIIGNGKTSEFMGSILATGNLKLTTTGHSGRVVVLGDVTHNRGGSEFHSYQFKPPYPLPDPDDICVDPPNYHTNKPTPAPVAVATPAAPGPSGKCTAIPQNRLPHGSWKTNNHECGKCEPPNAVTWWPCNKKPRLCEGNCQFSN